MIFIYSFAQNHPAAFFSSHSKEKSLIHATTGPNLASQTSLTSLACLHHFSNTGLLTGPQNHQVCSHLRTFALALPSHLDIYRVPSLTSFKASSKCRLLSLASLTTLLKIPPSSGPSIPFLLYFSSWNNTVPSNMLSAVPLYSVYCLPHPHKKVTSTATRILFCYLQSCAQCPD